MNEPDTYNWKEVAINASQLLAAITRYNPIRIGIDRYRNCLWSQDGGEFIPWTLTTDRDSVVLDSCEKPEIAPDCHPEAS